MQINLAYIGLVAVCFRTAGVVAVLLVEHNVDRGGIRSNESRALVAHGVGRLDLGNAGANNRSLYRIQLDLYESAGGVCLGADQQVDIVGITVGKSGIAKVPGSVPAGY